MQFMKTVIVLLLLTFLLLSPGAVFAGNWVQNAQTKLGAATQGLGFETSIEATTGSVLRAGLALGGTIFLILTVYAGILWMTASGNDDQIGKSKKILGASVIGLFIVMSSYAITQFVTTKLGAGGGPDEGPGGNIATEPSCASAGGDCIDVRANRGDACDPDGTGRDDWYTGTALGMCDDNRVCCEIKWTAENGQRRCRAMGGSCLGVNAGSSCEANGEVNVGECDAEGPDRNNQCCVAASR